MGQTLAEKILAAHADRDEVRPGEFTTARVDLVLANDITGPPTIAQFRGMGTARNAINLGLHILACPAAADAIPDGATVRIDLARGLIACGGNTIAAEPFPSFLQRLIASGGLVPYVRGRLAGGPRVEIR